MSDTSEEHNKFQRLQAWCDVHYVTSNHGLLHLIELILLILSYITAHKSVWCNKICHLKKEEIYTFFLATTLIFFLIVVLVYTASLFRVHKYMPNGSWNLIMLILTSLAAVFLLAASCLLTTNAILEQGLVAGVLLGFLSFAVFVAHAYMQLQEFKKTQPTSEHETANYDSEDGIENDDDIFGGNESALEHFSNGHEAPQLQILRTLQHSHESIKQPDEQNHQEYSLSQFQRISLSSDNSSTSSTLSRKYVYNSDSEKNSYNMSEKDEKMRLN